MANSTAAVNLRNAVKNGTPLFVDGVAQPIFPYTSGVPTKDGYSNDKSDIIRYSVYVETNYDTDGDGKLDLVKALVQLPRAPPRANTRRLPSTTRVPYITGCTDYGRSRGFNYKNADTDYDLDTLYGSAAPRDAQGEMSTMDAAKNASADEWYYLSPYESYPNYRSTTTRTLIGTTTSSCAAMRRSRSAVWAHAAPRVWKPAELTLKPMPSSA